MLEIIIIYLEISVCGCEYKTSHHVPNSRESRKDGGGGGGWTIRSHTPQTTPTFFNIITTSFSQKKFKAL